MCTHCFCASQGPHPERSVLFVVYHREGHNYLPWRRTSQHLHIAANRIQSCASHASHFGINKKRKNTRKNSAVCKCYHACDSAVYTVPDIATSETHKPPHSSYPARYIHRTASATLLEVYDASFFDPTSSIQASLAFRRWCNTSVMLHRSAIPLDFSKLPSYILVRSSTRRECGHALTFLVCHLRVGLLRGTIVNRSCRTHQTFCI